MRYLLLCSDEPGTFFPDLAMAEHERPGLYEWAKAFRQGGDVGEIKKWSDVAPNDFQNYDIIHVNLTGLTVQFPNKIRSFIKDSSTRLIVNQDYCMELFQQGFPEPQHYYDALLNADFVFAQEPAQQAWLNYVLHVLPPEDKKRPHVPLIPHPVDFDGISSLVVPKKRRHERIVTCYHRYDKNLLIPAAITSKIPTKIKGLAKDVWYPSGVLGFSEKNVPGGLFNFYWIYSVWPFFLHELAYSLVAFEYYVVHSHSRFPEECACLKVPCVGTMHGYSVQHLWGFTCHHIHDFAGMRRSIKRLLDDDAFYDEVCDYAYVKVQEQNYVNSKARLLIELDTWLKETEKNG